MANLFRRFLDILQALVSTAPASPAIDLLDERLGSSEITGRGPSSSAEVRHRI